MTATQLVRASAAASLATQTAAARALRRREDSGPVTTDQVSFTEEDQVGVGGGGEGVGRIQQPG